MGVGNEEKWVLLIKANGNIKWCPRWIRWNHIQRGQDLFSDTRCQWISEEFTEDPVRYEKQRTRLRNYLVLG